MARPFLILLHFFAIVCAFGQNDQLARNYLQQGQYEKAAATYEILLKNQPGNPTYALGAVEAYQQLEAYDKASQLLLNALKTGRPLPHLQVELGYNYQLQQKEKKADSLYKQAIAEVQNNPTYAYTVGRTFEEHTLLDQAITTYKTAMNSEGNLLFEIQLARIYGEQGDIALMLSTYIDLIARDNKFYMSAQRNFAQFITENPENEANQIFKTLLIKRSQQEPNLLYNRLLSWLFIQQKEYGKAFAQERAIFKRTDDDMQGVINLASITLGADEPDATREILEFIIAETADTGIKLSAQQKLLEIRVNGAKPTDFPSIKADFEQLLTENGKTAQTLSLQVAYAHFLGFQMDNKAEAEDFLQETLKLPLSRFQEARAKMELADLLVLEEKFGSALLYYTQIQKKVENDVLAQEARFKVAKTSYYNGDFEWAQTQLKVLKSSATQLIANDAQELFLLIADNSLEDSTHTALKLFARADLLAFQNKTVQAMETYATILTDHKGESIEDEALLAQAKLYEKQQNFAEAEKNYLKIIAYYKEDILADDAYYKLAMLYENQLQQPEKAKQLYEQIIFNHADSIYYVDAQKRYRMLRGDILN
ncbi:tetratricopeptide repeat protein [Flavimarina sp. Hel_I_48]|uniref:tetratricopeptide repeat protein n=1 Tax=Flavimarina sp. Hel_I_48 TaxID=1392488 RepID=UPI00068C60BE|nr:tetratricopeptide repeat protein [Flavimarina sp. Hel_I_48]